MSRDNKEGIFEGDSFKIVMYIAGIALAISIMVFIVVFLFYNDKLDNDAELSLIEMGAATNTLVPNSNTGNLAPVSITEDKTIGQSQNAIVVELERDETKENVAKSNEIQANTVEENTVESKKEDINNTVSEGNIKLEAPVSGDILTDYAEETLVYSNTLDEWTTHLGIDIKAERTTVVKAAQNGIVESIKSDPRYGLTVTIDHENGFKTVYSNLLTTEFVAEGERVEGGQTIATIGETSAFEISDEPHLHFEVLKDGKNVNPTIYLK